MRRILIVIALIVCELSDAYAQMPGRWEKTVICDHCDVPAGLDFVDRQVGVVAVKSQRLGFGSNTRYKSIIYSTLDGGLNWERKHDTISHPIVPGDRLTMHDHHLVINSTLSATLHSADLGDSICVFPLDYQAQRDYVYEFDFISASPTIIFRSIRPQVNQASEMQKMLYLVSRDSGSSYDTISILDAPGYNVLNVRLNDTNEIWALLGSIRTKIDSTYHYLPGRIIFSKDQGKSWMDVYLFEDTVGVDWGNSQFGDSDLGWREGSHPGKAPGSFYVLNTWYRSDTPNERRLSLMYTTDYGKTWTGDSTHAHVGSPYFDHLLIRNSSNTQLWSVFKDTQTVAFSPNNGKTWSHDSTTFRGAYIKHMMWKDSVTGYVLTHSADSTLTFWTFVPGPSMVEHQQKKPSRFISLPSNVIATASMKVQALLPLDGELTAYDVLGRVAWSQYVQAARSEIMEIRVPPSKGLYFLRYLTDGQQQSETYLRR